MRASRVLGAALLFALMAVTPVAQADPVQEFNVQIKNVKTDGRYTLVGAGFASLQTAAFPFVVPSIYVLVARTRVPAVTPVREEETDGMPGLAEAV